jgi:hypothetical protein
MGHSEDGLQAPENRIPDRAMRNMIWCTVLSMGLVACGGGGSGDDDDDDTPDAAQGQPDAAQNDPDAAPLVDAAPPAGAFACSAAGDYVEQDDAGNDLAHEGAPEDSGQTLGAPPTSFTLGGCIDTSFATTEDPPLADADFYVVTLEADAWITGRVTSADGTASDGGVAGVFDGDGNVVTAATLAGGTGSLAPSFAAAGAYLVAVFHDDPDLASSWNYQVVLETVDCVATGVPLSYDEAGDGAGSRGNDMFGAVYDPDFALNATALPTDVPEPSGVTVAAGERRRLRGNTGNVGVALMSEYLDQDTFAFTTGPDVTRLAFFTAWAGTANDLDLILVPADTIDVDAIVGYGGAIGGSVERAGAVVEPDTTYWVWAGNYMGSTPGTTGLRYNITVCGFE